MLNEEQQEVYNAILNSDERVIVLLGKAGSGKSYLISKLARDLGHKISITATTNKAKNLLIKSTRISDIRTIHSFCGYIMVLNGVEYILTKELEADYNDIVVVDEVSMLTQQILNTLLSTPTKKIVLVGDMSQLSSIGLRADISKYKTYYLTKNMRQVQNPILHSYLETLREKIEAKRIFSLDEDKPDCVMLYDSHKEFCKAYLDCKEDKRILAYSNSVVDAYNLNLNKGIKYKVGDLVVLDSPIGAYKNGDIVEITSIEERDDFTKLIIDEMYDVVVFRTKKDLEEMKYNNTSYYKTLLPSIANPKQIYASTIHKAQGDSIDEVFIDYTDIYKQLFRKPTKFNNYNKPIKVEEYLKLLYVAISRMRTKAHIFIGEKRDYKQLRKERK